MNPLKSLTQNADSALLRMFAILRYDYMYIK